MFRLTPMMKITITDSAEKTVRTFAVTDDVAHAIDTLLLAMLKPTDFDLHAQQTAEKARRDARHASPTDSEGY